MTKLSNVRGRITYISSHAKQEHLYAVYETTDRNYWTELARCSQQEFNKSGVEGKCIEGREIIIALPESLYEQGMPDILLRSFTDKFKEKYRVECVAALHHNKRMTNFHIHLIFSERQLLEEPVIKTATRNMFYDERGNHVRTKKEILDEAGNIRKRCKVIGKGEVYEKKLFTSKNMKFKQEEFLDEVKLFYTRMINRWVTDEKDRLTVFDRDGPYLATKKIGRNNPKAEQQRGNLEIELSDLKGLAKITRKADLQRKIDEKTYYINRLKIGLSNMVRNYGFENINEFYLSYKESKSTYAEYQQKTEDWKKSFGNTDNSMDKAETMSEKLARLQKEADSYRQYNRRMSNKLR